MRSVREVAEDLALNPYALLVKFDVQATLKVPAVRELTDFIVQELNREMVERRFGSVDEYLSMWDVPEIVEDMQNRFNAWLKKEGRAERVYEAIMANRL